MDPISRRPRAATSPAPAPYQVRAKTIECEYRAELRELAETQPNELREILVQAFGAKLDNKKIEALEAAARDGKIAIPRHVRFVSEETLRGADGAYSSARGGTVYLNDTLDPDRLRAVYAEESAHHLDHLLGGEDAPGDEGNIFSIGIMRRARLDDRELAVARADQDHGTIGIKRKVELAQPEDAAEQMIGRAFDIPVGLQFGEQPTRTERVTITAWDNHKNYVEARDNIGRELRVAKSSLILARDVVPGVVRYEAGVETRKQALAEQHAKLARWTAREAEYTTPAQKLAFERETNRLNDVIAGHERELNKELIQETMYNRFDATIQQEVARINTARGWTGDDALDPNLVKSMLFQESQLGTSGQFLGMPGDPVMTMQNIGQVVDSVGLVLLGQLERERPAAFSAATPNIRADLAAAQKELADLEKIPHRTAAENIRLAELQALKSNGSIDNWEPFIRGYVSPQTGTSFAELAHAYWAETTPPRNERHEYWIGLTVDWLVEKRQPGMNWQQAISAYNGGGARALNYGQDVVERARAAARDAAAGRAFVPPGI